MRKRPNILLITTDQHRGDCCGSAQRAHPVMTPHLDQLAAEGVRFERAYSDGPVCIPARMTIMTGKCAYTHGVTAYGEFRMPEAAHQTLPGRLASAGYQTHAAGKMHFYPPRQRNGFDRMRLVPEDYINWLEGTPYAGLYRGHGIGGNEIHPAFSAVPAEYTATHWTVQESIDFLRQRDPEAPFFMWTSFEAPHPPYDPVESYVRLYDGVQIPEPFIGDWTKGDKAPNWVINRYRAFNLERQPPSVIQAARKHYYAQITHIDYQLGRLFGELKSQKLWEDTVILFTSDHGELLGDHGMFHKNCYYEGSARVPFILRVPQQYESSWKPGAVVDAPVQLADIYPTFMELAGCSKTDDRTDRDGMDLSRIAKEALEGRWIYGFLDGENGGLHMATDGRWKYLYYVWGGTEQLFDLHEDPNECHNLAEDQQVKHILELCQVKMKNQFSDFTVNDIPLPEASEVRARNPLAWRGPIRYGGHW